jgi:hypothetical protein
MASLTSVFFTFVMELVTSLTVTQPPTIHETIDRFSHSLWHRAVFKGGLRVQTPEILENFLADENLRSIL